jgi:DNA-binding protein Fis
MSQSNGSQTHAARLLDISRDALRYKLKKFGLMHAEEDAPSSASSS